MNGKQLSKIQRASILDLRKKGLTFAQIANEMGVTRQAIQYLEKQELAKLGVLESIAKGDHKRDRIEYGTIYREYAARTNLGELHFTEAPTFWAQGNRQRMIERLEKTIDNLADELIAGRSEAWRTWAMIEDAQHKIQAA